jgi:nucleobase:cation symporter-1, NCS1 family
MLTKGNIMVTWLFDPTKSNIYYRYHKGWNVQAIIAYVAGIALPFPGFVASLGALGIDGVGYDMYYVGWLLSFVVSFVLYTIICKFWPTEFQQHVVEKKWTWEEAALIALESQVETGQGGESNQKTKADEEGIEKEACDGI